MQNEIIKSSHYYATQILSVMTNNDIWEIVVWKISELNNEKNTLAKEIFWLRWDSRKLMELFSLDRQKEIEKIIKYFQFQLKQRDPFQKTNKISIEELKQKIDIVSLIEILTWEWIESTRRLMKCPLRWHNDNTASFKIYENTDSFYCQGCHRWWDTINFIEYFYWISRKEAIKKFISLTK